MSDKQSSATAKTVEVFNYLLLYNSLRCLELKSYGFKKKLVDSCQAPTRSCQLLNFCFPGKTEQFY